MNFLWQQSQKKERVQPPEDDVKREREKMKMFHQITN